MEKKKQDNPVSSEKNKDLTSLKARIEKLKKHFGKNIHDYKTKRTLFIKEAKLRKLEKYSEKRKR